MSKRKLNVVLVSVFLFVLLVMISNVSFFSVINFSKDWSPVLNHDVVYTQTDWGLPQCSPNNGVSDFRTYNVNLVPELLDNQEYNIIHESRNLVAISLGNSSKTSFKLVGINPSGGEVVVLDSSQGGTSTYCANWSGSTCNMGVVSYDIVRSDFFKVSNEGVFRNGVLLKRVDIVNVLGEDRLYVDGVEFSELYVVHGFVNVSNCQGKEGMFTSVRILSKSVVVFDVVDNNPVVELPVEDSVVDDSSETIVSSNVFIDFFNSIWDFIRGLLGWQ
jgi:hypothetical protein